MIQLPPPTITTAEELLVEFEQTGDTAPFEEIVRRYSGMVYGICYRVTRNAHDAEDATQATFLKLATYARTGFGARNNEDGRSEPGRPPRVGPWLQQVAKTTAVDLRRSKTRRHNREQIRAAIEDQQQPISDATDDVTMDELKQVLRDEVDRLPVHYRTPLILYYFGGLSTEQIAVELKTNAKALAVRLFRARKMLGSRLTARGVGAAGGALACLSIADSILAALAGKVWQTAGASGICAGGGMFASAGGTSWLTSHSAVVSTIAGRINATVRATAVGMVASKWKMSIAMLLTVGTTMAGTSEIVQKAPVVQDVARFLQEIGESLKEIGNFGRSLRDSTPGLRAEGTTAEPPATIAQAPVPVPPVRLEPMNDAPIATSNFAPMRPQGGVASAPPMPKPASLPGATGGNAPASTDAGRFTNVQLNLPSATQSLLAMGNSGSQNKGSAASAGDSKSGGEFVGPIAIAESSKSGFQQLMAGVDGHVGPYQVASRSGEFSATDGGSAASTGPVDGPIAMAPTEGIDATGPADGSTLASGTDLGAIDSSSLTGGGNSLLIDPTPLFTPTTPANPIPEPGAVGLLALGAAGLLARRRRR